MEMAVNAVDGAEMPVGFHDKFTLSLKSPLIMIFSKLETFHFLSAYSNELYCLEFIASDIKM